MTKRWSSVRSDLLSTKREASKHARAAGKRIVVDYDDEITNETIAALNDIVPDIEFANYQTVAGAAPLALQRIRHP